MHVTDHFNAAAFGTLQQALGFRREFEAKEKELKHTYIGKNIPQLEELLKHLPDDRLQLAEDVRRSQKKKKRPGLLSVCVCVC